MAVKSRAEAQRVLAELVRRADQVGKINFRSLAFEKQLAFIEDKSHLTVAICGRRGGKTQGVALLLLDTAQRKERSQVFYITLTRPAAKRNMWPYLIWWNDKLKLGATFNRSELSMTLPNGSIIYLGGANDEGEIERYRGIAMGSPLFVLDEAQAFRPFLERFITDILQPATMDQNGRIVMIGTPNVHALGYFHDAYHGLVPGWSTHHWTVYDNTYVQNADEFIEKNVLTLRRITKDDPAFKREYLGQWVKSTSGLVFPIPQIALIDELPEGINDWRYVLGMDVGYVDATSFVSLAYSVDAGLVVNLGSHQKSGMIPTAVCAEVDKLSEVYDYERIVVDPGGGGKGIVEEMKQRWGLNAIVAQKREKHAYIELLNGDLRNGSFKIIKDSNEELLHDASILQWDYARAEKKGGVHTKLRTKDLAQIDDRTPDHLLDGQLYGWRDCKAYLHDDEHNAPKPGSREALEAEEAAMLAKAIKKQQTDQNEDWWAQGFDAGS